jgi:CheY-specific phosphatase CheX
MSTDSNYVVLVEPPDGQLATNLTPRLQTLGLPVALFSSVEEAESFLQGGQLIALVGIDDALGMENAGSLLANVRATLPGVPVLWVTREEPSELVFSDATPDKVVAHRSPVVEVIRYADEALLRFFYPDIVVNVLRESIVSVMSSTFKTEGTVARIGLRTNRNLLAYVNGLLPFAGRRTSGRLVVSAAKTYLGELRRRIVPAAAPPSLHEAEDLAGEMCNQVLGRLKGFFWRKSLPVEFGLPIIIRGQNCEVRYKAPHPSIVFDFQEPMGTVHFEFCFDLFDAKELDTADVETVAPAGSLLFL